MMNVVTGVIECLFLDGWCFVFVDDVFDELCGGDCEVFDCVHVGFLCSGLFGDELFVFSFDDVECDWCGDDGYVCE